VAYSSKLDQARASADHYRRNREKTLARIAVNKAAVVAEYRARKEATPCTDCGLFFPYYVTQYDHLDSSTKSNTCAALANGGSRLRLLEEIAKCELVCANCHAVRTHDRLNPESRLDVQV
jgi:hypothetical protein